MKETVNRQTVIISGGLGDIAMATALAFALDGTRVALGDLHSREQAVPYLEKLTAQGAKIHYTKVDVADPFQVQNWVEEVDRIMGPPQRIIANAAIVHRGGIHDLSAEQWKRQLDVNLNGAFFLAQRATALLIEKQLPGRVVFVGSWAGTHVHSHMPAYSVSKAALTMLCKCMALELAPQNILINELAPGYVNAGLSGQMWRENPDLAEKARARVPVQQLIDAKEVAEQILYLCSEKNRHMTGSTLLMDGGLSLL